MTNNTIGHEDAITCLSIMPNFDIISGSIDKYVVHWTNCFLTMCSINSTARIWRGGKCIKVLSGHAAPVWGVLSLPNGNIVTGTRWKILVRISSILIFT